MAILVTGGCGFVGINLAENLLGRGEAVVLFDQRALPAAAKTALQRQGGSLDVVQGDACDREALAAAMRRFDVTRAVHAAVITSGASREAEEPGAIVAANVGGTVSFLEAARVAGCSRVICVGSGSAYGRTLDETGPLREDASPSWPLTLYGITKYAAERTALRLRALWDFDAVCVRLGSVFGPWEYPTGVRDRMSPQLQIARLAVHSKGARLPPREVRRDWVYSRDVAEGLASLLLAGRTCNALYHLSAGSDWPGFFSAWCDTLRAVYPSFSWRVARGGEQANIDYHADSDRAVMDISRLTGDIGFIPRFGLQAACADFAAWIQAHEAFVVADAAPSGTA